MPVALFPLATTAQQLAAALLGHDPVRWRHTQAVVSRAAEAAGVLAPEQRAVLLAAAWLHDIGYHPALRDSGFHPLDGARYLRAHGWPDLITTLVAHHSGADDVARVHGLEADLDAFDDPQGRTGALPDALAWADQTTGPRGEALTLEERLADMLRRHGPDSPNARAHPRREQHLRAALARTEARRRDLRAAPVPARW